MLKRCFCILTALLPILLISCSSVEEAEYKITKKDGPFELRQYSPHILAETSVDASLEQAGNKAFQRLFGYISGKNKTQTKIAMTAPVSQESSSDKIAMTAPVGQQKSENGWMVSFIMPQSYTIETIPLPDDKNIQLRQVPAQEIAAIIYSGTWSEENYLEHLGKLKEWVKKQDLQIINKPVWARYNPPFTLWFLRRNEILFLVKKHSIVFNKKEIS